MKRLLIISALILIFCSPIYAKSSQVTFVGEKVVEENEVGIMIMTAEDNKIFFAVTSPKYHYEFILPYQLNWVFEKNDQYFLFGTNENRNISIDIFSSDRSSDQDFFENMKQKIIENQAVNGVESSELIQKNKLTILKTVSDMGRVSKIEGFKNVKQQHFYITKSDGKSRYILHFSMVMKENSETEFNQYMNYLSKSFGINFMRK